VKAVTNLIKYIRSKCTNADKIIRHFDVTGKSCPASMIKENTWKDFKKEINCSAAPSNHKDKNTKTVIVNSLNVRKGAGINYEIIDKVKNGTIITIIGSSKDTNGNVWYCIKHNGKMGYVNAKYVK